MPGPFCLSKGGDLNAFQLKGNSCNLDKTMTLKVPKREIFDRSDFPDFYTIKCLREGDCGVKFKK